jgi:hypothetical protein
LKHYENENRTQSLQRLIPDLYDYKTVLYVGARSDRFDYGKDFRAYNYEITVLEAFETNVNYLKNIDWIKEVIHGDVRDFTSNKTWDIVFSWHGPEHVEVRELTDTLLNLESFTNKAIVLGCPWGLFHQKAIHNNPFEVHASHNDYHIFENLGYNVECLGKKDVKGSNITAVKRI